MQVLQKLSQHGADISSNLTSSEHDNDRFCLPPALQEIVKTLLLLPDPMDRYKRLISYGHELKPMPESDRMLSNQVPGCPGVAVRAWSR